MSGGEDVVDSSAAAHGSAWDEEFSRFFAARASMLRSTAYLLCGDWHQAEDLTQTAFLKLYAAWPRLSRHDALDAYARRVVVRTFLAEFRRPWRRRERVTDNPPEQPIVSGGDTEERLLVWRALSLAPPKQRAVLVLRYWNDLSVEETAAALNCSTGNVKSQSSRGLAALRNRLGPAFTEAAFGARSGGES